MSSLPTVAEQIALTAPAGRATRAARRALNTARLLHAPVVSALRAEEERRADAARIFRTRFERIAAQSSCGSGERKGDLILRAMRDTFHNGLGIKWGENQIRVFNAFVFSSLALIYGDDWASNKARVLAEWGEQRECPYTVVSMARRNGKTYSTSGVVVSMLLCIPGIKVAIFSTCKRTSQMMMTAVVDMIDKAFERGTHANKQQFVRLQHNMESIIFEGPDKTKRELGCFPGSVKVRNVCVGGGGGSRRLSRRRSRREKLFSQVKLGDECLFPPSSDQRLVQTHC